MEPERFRALVDEAVAEDFTEIYWQPDVTAPALN